jgi:hypothetical protein
MEAQDVILKNQELSIKKQDQALELMTESNRLFGEILVTLKK